jgi:hypothetical protein
MPDEFDVTENVTEQGFVKEEVACCDQQFATPCVTTKGNDGVGIAGVALLGGGGSMRITLTNGVYYDIVLPVGPQGIQGIQGVQGTSITSVTTVGINMRVTLSTGVFFDIPLIQGPAGANGVDGAAGLSVVSATVNGSNELILTMSNGTTINAGVIPGIAGPPGPPGPTGATGATGATGPVGPAGPTFAVRDNAAADLNTRITTDSYYIDDISACAGSPTGLANDKAFLEIRAFSGNVIQTLTLITGVIYTRFYSGAWTHWFYYTGTDSGS